MTGTCIRLSLLMGTVAALAGAGPAAAQGWTASVELGAARAVSGGSIFHDTGQVEAAALRRWGDRFLAGGFLDFRPVVDQTPASSFWYADLGARADLDIYRRLFGTLSVGWALRHIGLSDGVSNTVAGLAVGAGVGGTLVAHTGMGAIYLLAASRATWAIRSENFAVIDVGLAIGCRLELGARRSTRDARP